MIDDVEENGFTAQEKELIALRNRVRDLEAEIERRKTVLDFKNELLTELRAKPQGLSFAHFRAVNVERAKTFPSAKQAWTPSDWMVALMGEVGELAATLPDAQRTELGMPFEADRAEMMKRVIAALGAVCNTAKKLRRGIDYTKGKSEQVLQADLEQQMIGLQFWTSRLCDVMGLSHWTVRDGVSVQASAVLDAKGDRAGEIGDVQTYLDLLAHSIDIDTGPATVEKFNVVSKRVGSPLMLESR